MMFTLTRLGVRFGRTLALDDLDFQIDTGITGLFGPNASGKSTLLRVLAGLQRPTSGTITIDDKPLSIADETWRAHVGYAGHGSGLYARLTLSENLELFARLYGVSSERVGTMLAALDLEDQAHKRTSALSAGNKRRAAVARALLHDPDVLLLDEPYANLDDTASELVSRTVTGWFRPGRVAVVATHGAKRVRAYATKGIVLQRGRVARQPDYEEVEVKA
jgi:heme ABC exporter ATP-binding subunit CcmA